MIIGKIFGVKIKLNKWFLALLLIYLLIDWLPQALIIFGVAFLHEAAHAVVAKNYGYRVLEIEILPFGGVAKIDNIIGGDVQSEFNVAMAGPLNNLVLMGVGWFMQYYHIWNPQLAFFFIRVNFFMAMFNLIPALPLDGGRIYRACLAHRKGFKKATEQASQLSQMISAVLMIIGVLGFYLGYVNAMVMVVALFLFGAATREKKMTMYVNLKNCSRKKEELLRKGIISNEQMVVMESTPVGEVMDHFLPHKYHTFIVMNHQWQIDGVVTEAQVIDTIMETGVWMTMKQILSKNEANFWIKKEFKKKHRNHYS